MRNKQIKTAAVVALLLAASAGSAFAKAVVFNQGWGCRLCGYSNGPSVSGAVEIRKFQVKAIKLPEGKRVELQSENK